LIKGLKFASLFVTTFLSIARMGEEHKAFTILYVMALLKVNKLFVKKKNVPLGNNNWNIQAIQFEHK